MNTAHCSTLDDNTQHTNAHAIQLLRHRQQYQNTRSLLRQLFEEECFAKGDSAVKVCHKADALLGTLPACVTAKALNAKDKRVAAEVLNIYKNTQDTRQQDGVRVSLNGANNPADTLRILRHAVPQPGNWNGCVVDIGSGGGMVLAVAAAGGYRSAGIEIHREDHAEAKALTAATAASRVIDARVHTPKLHYGPLFDAQRVNLEEIIYTPRGGCYAYLVGINWHQHIRVARQVATCDKVEWLVWCTTSENDLTTKQLCQQLNHTAGPNRIYDNCLTGRTLLAALRAYSQPHKHWYMTSCTKQQAIDSNGDIVGEGGRSRAYLFVCMPTHHATPMDLSTSPLPTHDRHDVTTELSAAHDSASAHTSTHPGTAIRTSSITPRHPNAQRPSLTAPRSIAQALEWASCTQTTASQLISWMAQLTPDTTTTHVREVSYRLTTQEEGTIAEVHGIMNRYLASQKHVPGTIHS